MNYVLDTNIIFFYLKSKATKSWIEAEYQPFTADNNAIVSIVTIGELRALAAKNDWGARRLSTVEQILNRLVVVDVKYGALTRPLCGDRCFQPG